MLLALPGLSRAPVRDFFPSSHINCALIEYCIFTHILLDIYTLFLNHLSSLVLASLKNRFFNGEEKAATPKKSLFKKKKQSKKQQQTEQGKLSSDTMTLTIFATQGNVLTSAQKKLMEILAALAHTDDLQDEDIGLIDEKIVRIFPFSTICHFAFAKF